MKDPAVVEDLQLPPEPNTGSRSEFLTERHTGFLGIDPGASGGIAVVTASNHAWAWNMPETEGDVLVLIEHLAPYCVTARIERVQAMPDKLRGRRQGGSSIFKFGTGYGGLRMALMAARIRWATVEPAKWQQVMSCRTRGDKNISKAAAQRLFPRLKVTLAVADALLIAECCRRLDGRP